MKKMYTPVFMGRILFAAVAIMISVFSANAQTPMYFKTGTGTGGNTIPLNQASQKTQLLYTPSDFNILPISGNITKIWFRNSAAGATGTYTDFQLSFIQNTDASFPSTSFYTGLTTALSSASLNVTANATAGGWFEIPIPAGSFPYDNSKTLIIQIQYTAKTGGISTTTSTSVGNKRCSGQSLTNTTGTTNTIWNDFGIDVIPGGACTNPPVPGIISSTASSVCLNIPFTLSMTGGTNGAGQTYQWYSSPDNNIWTPISGATNSNLTTTQAASTYYRLEVTCGTAANSNVVQVLSGGQVQGTFTINNALPTGGTNFNSFNDAYDFIKCGISGSVEFNVAAGSGPYIEQLIMTEVPGASGSKTVTFNGNGASLSYTSIVTGERGVIKLNGADHITFNNLVINANGTTTTEYGFGVQLMNSADSNTINNCTININTTSDATNYAGIVVSASATSATTTGTVLCDFNTFSNNTITGGHFGITLVGSGTEANFGNKIVNNTIKDFYQYGIYVYGSSFTEIEANRISRPTRTSVTNFFGIYFTNLSANAIITRNRIFDPFGGAPASTSTFNGIYFTANDGFSGLENKVTNNLIYNISGSGDAYGIYNTSSDNVWYYHNTISMDGNPATSSATSIVRGFYQTTLATGIEFRDNITTISRSGAGTKYALYFATATSQINSNNNNFFITSSTGINNLGFFTSAYTSLADWQVGTSMDVASVSEDPVFANAGGGDFTPTNASINDLGVPLGILVDLNNNPRSAITPDMGAVEFSPGPCIAPPTPGTSNVTPDPVCENSFISLTLSGNSTGLGQTYQWQTSPTIGGPYTNISGLLTNPSFNTVSTSTLYYRVAVTCSGNTVFSTPVLLNVTPALQSNTYTINKTQPTSGLNYNSFADAKSALDCGIVGPVVFEVVAGTGPYDEQFILGVIKGATEFNTVTFNGNGNSLRFNPTDNAERAVIKLRNTDHVIFDSLTIDATLAGGTYGYGVQLINNADSNIFRNCTIISNLDATTTNFAGIVINSSETAAVTTGATLCDNNLFNNNKIIGGYYGITCVGSTADPVNDNIFTNNEIRDFYSYGVYLGPSANTLVEKNNIHRPTRANAAVHYGVYVTGTNTAFRISKNRIHNPFGGNLTSTAIFNGIYLTGVDGPLGAENFITNNLIYNVNGDGAQYGLYNTGSNNAWYYHNTVSLDDVTSTSTALTRGFYQTTLAEGIIFKNNIITIRRGGTGVKHAIYFNTTTSTIISNRNDFYVNSAGGGNFTGFFSANQITLADWQTAAGQDLNSVREDPEYANTLFGDYTPTLGALDNLGEPVSITTDILDAARSATTPDIGAYEFTVPPCTTPPTAGVAAVSPNAGICVGTNVILSLSGNSIGSGQTYQWQASPDGINWTNIGPVLNNPLFLWAVTTSNFFQAVVTCNGISSTSTVTQVSLNPAFLGGNYTINPATPPFYPTPGSVNFESFSTAVAALECGITDAVYFDVAPGVYNEQVRIHAVGGTSDTKRVTFRSANGDPGSVTLFWDAVDATKNYTVKLDSASYITFKNMTLAATNTTNGRVIELANLASFDSITNCRINSVVTTATTNLATGIFANALKGGKNVIKGNTVSNGSTGIYMAGTGATILTYDNVIDSNTVEGSNQYGIYIGFNGRAMVSKNTVNITMPRNATNYGIYSTSSDSAYQYVANKINIDDVTATTTYGMYFTGCDARPLDRGRIAGNTILALNGNTGTIYGLYQTANTFNNTVNNVISIKTSGATSYGSYYTTGGGVNFHNNSILNASTSATANNIAAYFGQSSGANPSINVQNNIFAHQGGGKAMFVTNLNFIYSDYNTFYTNGPTLINWNAANAYATLQQWVNAAYWDVNSIVYQPAFASVTTLEPNLASPEVWAIHGRGTQIPGNDYDFNNNPRPTTFTAGVPDMGAYEFLPTSLPTILTATPANPAPGITQTFMYGTDTVAKITYDAVAPVPASITMRRYSGVLPTGLSAGQESMYFYTDVDVPAQGAYKYKIDQFFIDPWRGFIPTEPEIKMGRTNASDVWEMIQPSTTDVTFNIITDSNIVHFDRYTGLRGVADVNSSNYTTVIDTSNRGTRFWVPYGHHYSFTSNAQDMWLYLSAEDSANVTVRINGTNWKRTYSIPANTVKVSDIMPKYGMLDARITDEGLYNRGISITSDVPIVAYAHIYDGATSGASMLLPVGVYGYEYQSLNARQYYSSGSYSWMSVMTDRDSTLVEITPAVTTKGGRPAGVPFTVLLMQGEVYNIMGTTSGSAGTDLSGTLVKSIANQSGNCYPIAVFSGSTRTAICYTSNGDNMIQQVFPSQAWGRKYLASASATTTSNTNYNANIFRVMVKDPATVVMKNGVQLTGLVTPGNYYEFNTTSGAGGANTSAYIEANKPVMVAQYFVSTSANGCPGITVSGNGDPEMIYISPIEQGIKKIVFYNTNESAITANYVNIIIPTAGLATLKIDNNSTFTHTYAHPHLAGYSCVRHNLGSTAAQHIVTSDSAFTAITYGLGSVESYGYNAGTLVKNLNALPNIKNTLGTGDKSDYTCVDAPFRFNIRITAKPQELTWKFSEIATLTPNADVIQVNPVPFDSAFINNRWFYDYTVSTNYTFTTPGTFYIPILITDSLSIEGCDNSLEIILKVVVLPKPVADFTASLSVCLGDNITFNGTGTTSNGVAINAYNWDFDDGTGTGQTATHLYNTPGSYNVNLQIVALDGCVGDTTKTITVSPKPVVDVTPDSITVCIGDDSTLNVVNPQAGVTYNWYDAATGGTLVHTGESFTLTNISAPAVYYVEGAAGTCITAQRKKVTINISTPLPRPVAVVDSSGASYIKFKWDAVLGAIGYEVSINNGVNWTVPSSGPAGLTHTVSGLQPLQEVTLIVRALGTVDCQSSESDPVTGKTFLDQLFIPNTFTPNGDGRNDVLQVYGFTIQRIKFVVFNQWGEKIVESTNPNNVWDGTFKGKPQPSGVYMYVCQITLTNGTTMTKKGSINLIR